MMDIVDLNADHSISRQRAHQNSTQRVTERNTETAFQGLYDKLAASTVFTQVNGRDIGSFNLYHSYNTLL